MTDCHNCIAVQPVSLHFCNIRHNSETSPVSTSNCLLADISTGAGKLRRRERPGLEADRRLVSVMIRHANVVSGHVPRTATRG